MHKVIQGNNIDILKQYPDNHFDSIVTDPPYGIEFLAKEWDKNTGAVETWQECFRVLKPGGYLLAFSAARTYHNLATNIEGVGFEIRDQLMWLYASGFPKAQDVGKNIAKKQQNKKNMSLPQAEWDNLTLIEGTGSTGSIYRHSNGKKYRQLRNTKSQRVAQQYGGGEWKDTYEEIIEHNNEWSGWKTALKPAHEPIVMARKPFRGSCVDNVLTHGVGALNIDATRIDWEDGEQEKEQKWREKYGKNGVGGPTFQGTDINTQTKGGETIDAPPGRFPSNVLGEVTDYQKFFYCPKVSRAERHCGFEQTNIPTTSGGMYDNHGTGKMYSIGTDMDSKVDPLAHIPSTKGGFLGTDGEWNTEHWHGENGGRNKSTSVGNNHPTVKADPLAHIPTNSDGMLEAHYEKDAKGNPIYNNQKANIGNNHPTIKPVALMKYLVKLVTPEGGKVLDPFTGSGSTGMAAVELGYDFTGCELDPDYVDIANRRITAWHNKTDLDKNPLPAQWFEETQ